VVAADDPGRPESRAALVSLSENYWYPLYAYVRRRGYADDEAQDLTQEFFVRLLGGRYLDRADREKGRFRSFLLGQAYLAQKKLEPARRNLERARALLLELEAEKLLPQTSVLAPAQIATEIATCDTLQAKR